MLIPRLGCGKIERGFATQVDELQAVPTEAEIIKGIQAPGRYNANVGLEAENVLHV